MGKISTLAVLALTCVIMMSAAGTVWAATDTQTLTVSATVSDRAKLTLGTGAISFADADPDVTASIAAAQNPVSVEVKAHAGGGSTVTLTVQANGDLLTAGSDVIGIDNVTWTASGAGFVAGTMDTAVQTAGSWAGSGQRSGTFSYFLGNSWDYPAGSYTQTVVYTLTAP